jgi:uncharacterized membrane protein required for colicin V production
MDLILVGFVAGLTFGGWRTGFLHRLAGLAFAAIAFVAGAYLRGPFGTLIHGIFPNVPADYAELLGYAFAFPIILAVIHVVAYPFLKDKHMSGMTRELDKALGAIFGFIEGVLILSILVVIFDTYFGTAWASCPASSLPSTSRTPFTFCAIRPCRSCWPCLDHCCPRTSAASYRAAYRVCLEFRGCPAADFRSGRTSPDTG